MVYDFFGRFERGIEMQNNVPEFDLLRLPVPSSKIEAWNHDYNLGLSDGDNFFRVLQVLYNRDSNKTEADR